MSMGERQSKSRVFSQNSKGNVLSKPIKRLERHEKHHTVRSTFLAVGKDMAEQGARGRVYRLAVGSDQ